LKAKKVLEGTTVDSGTFKNYPISSDFGSARDKDM